MKKITGFIISMRRLATMIGIALLLTRVQSADALSATGGTITTNGGFIIHSFTAVGTNYLTVTAGGKVEVLVVAGGGGGGYYAGGGGAGGLVTNSDVTVVVSNMAVVVGDGGAGDTDAGGAGARGQNSVFGAITAYGGGGGGSRNSGSPATGVSGADGGSGGGGSPADGAPQGLGGAATNGQGFAGGTGCTAVASGWGGGGGGGAGGVGGNATGNSTTASGGTGGVGVTCAILGSPVYYAGGGGGGTYSGATSGTAAPGGLGGGGAGSKPNGAAGVDGTANTGGGGGGGAYTGRGGKGGSGLVIVRYAMEVGPPQISVSAATGIAQTTAYLNGTLASTGTSATAVWVYWGATSGGTNVEGWDTGAFVETNTVGPTSYSIQASGLTPGQTYVYRYVAQNESGAVWTADQPFTTLIAPSVQNLSPINLQPTSATLRGQVTAGNPAPLACICWGSADPLTDNTGDWQNVTAMGAQAGVFSTNVTGLTVGTTNYYRCYVTNSEGVAWAATSTNFVTPSITTYTFTNNNANWSLATSWSPAGGPPATTNDCGIVPTGMTATANAELGILGNRPTIQIDAGGQINQAFDAMVTPLTLNGGFFYPKTYNCYSPINVMTDSRIQNDSDCCGGKTFGGNISGPGRIAFIRKDSWQGLNFTGVNTFTGGIDLIGSNTLSTVNFTANSLGTNGSGSFPNTVTVYPLFGISLNATMTRDITLNGGMLQGWGNSSVTLNGTVTLTASSSFRATGCCAGGFLTINGPVNGGPYKATVSADSQYGGDLIFTTPTTNWTGGLEVSYTYPGKVVKFTAQGAQGTGPIVIDNNATLAFDAAVDQDWFITNNLASASGATNAAVVKLEAGAATAKRLTLCGSTLAPGGTNGVGLLTVNGKFAFTNAGSTFCTLALDIPSTNQVAGVDYDQLVVSSLADTGLANGITNCDLVVNVTPAIDQLNGQTLTVISAAGSDFTGKAFRSVTWNGAAGTVVYDNGHVRVQFSTGGEAPVVNNGVGATGIRVIGATLNGQVTQGNPGPTVYICYGLTDGGTSGTGSWDSAVNMDAQTASFSNNVTGLLGNTTYWYRCFATNASGVAWSDATNFNTLATLTFTFTNNGTSWTLPGSWSPAGGPPQSAGEFGIVPTGLTATANADLGSSSSRPTIRIDAGGQVNQTVDLSTPLALNGGLFHITGFMDNLSPLNVMTDSTIQSDVQCCNGKSIAGNISGPGKLTFIRYGGASREINISGNNTFSGGIEFRGQGSSSALVQLYANSLSTNGAGATPNTVIFGTNAYVAFYCYPAGFGITRDLTLDGGSLGLEHGGFTLNGILTLAADSTLFTAGFASGGGFTVNGPVVGGYGLTCQSDWSAVIFTTDSPNWTGGLTVSGTQGTKVTATGAQGRGPLRIADGATLMFDAVADRDWFVTNDLASVSGATNAVVKVEAGVAATNTLNLCGRTLAPGGTNGVGLLTVNGRLRLASDGVQRATLAVTLNGTNAFTGTNGTNSYSQLAVNGSLVDLGGQNLAVTVGTNYVPTVSDVFYILLNGGTNAIANTFYNAPEGGKVTCRTPDGRSGKALISYVANGDGGVAANDVSLSQFVFGTPGTVFTIR